MTAAIDQIEALLAAMRRNAQALLDSPYQMAGQNMIAAIKWIEDQRAVLPAFLACARALKPFAECCDQIADDESDEEWAKFRLLVKDYRAAAEALKMLESGG